MAVGKRYLRHLEFGMGVRSPIYCPLNLELDMLHQSLQL